MDMDAMTREPYTWQEMAIFYMDSEEYGRAMKLARDIAKRTGVSLLDAKAIAVPAVYRGLQVAK